MSGADRHGTSAGYKKGCRCEQCRQAKAAARAEALARKAELEDEPVVVDVLRIPVSCPHCGGALVHLAEGRPTQSGTRVSVMLRCSVAKCRRQWLVTTIIQSPSGAEFMGAA